MIITLPPPWCYDRYNYDLLLFYYYFFDSIIIIWFPRHWSCANFARRNQMRQVMKQLKVCIH